MLNYEQSHTDIRERGGIAPHITFELVRGEWLVRSCLCKARKEPYN